MKDKETNIVKNETERKEVLVELKGVTYLFDEDFDDIDDL